MALSAVVIRSPKVLIKMNGSGRPSRMKAESAIGSIQREITTLLNGDADVHPVDLSGLALRLIDRKRAEITSLCPLLITVTVAY